MEFQIFFNLLEITLIAGVIAALVLALWISTPVGTYLTTVSWNG